MRRKSRKSLTYTRFFFALSIGILTQDFLPPRGVSFLAEAVPWYGSKRFLRGSRERQSPIQVGYMPGSSIQEARNESEVVRLEMVCFLVVDRAHWDGCSGTVGSRDARRSGIGFKRCGDCQ